MSLMSRFIKSSEMEKATSLQKLMKVDVLDKNNQKNYNKIDVGFSTDLELKSIAGKKLGSKRQLLEFRMECKAMFETIISRLMKKSPLTYTLVRNLSSLDPCEVGKADEDVSCDRFKRVLNVLHS